MSPVLKFLSCRKQFMYFSAPRRNFTSGNEWISWQVNYDFTQKRVEIFMWQAFDDVCLMQ